MHVARIILVVLALGLAGCGGGDDDEQDAADETAVTTTSAAADDGACRTVDAPELKPDGGQQSPVGTLDATKAYSLLVETSCGAFTIELDQKLAPKTSASLVSLAENGFFDNTIFHRVVPGFVIQGGDPTGSGTGGPGYKTVDVPPPGAAYTEGVVAMAKAGFEPPGTAGSQFFVVTGPDVGLPAEYAIVGKVTDGLEAVKAIDALGAGDGPPSMPVVIERVTVSEP
ncbi:MAG: peptidylprolyl isomerase [Actinomycetota bacterium]|nr:peptidylprolyl isomerase [Actinomycetota bacterium]